MKTQNDGLVAFAHSSYCLTIHQLLILFIGRHILEDQDISPLEGIKMCGDYNLISQQKLDILFALLKEILLFATAGGHRLRRRTISHNSNVSM